MNHHIPEEEPMPNRLNRHTSRIVAAFAFAALTIFLVGLSASAQDNERSVSEVLMQSAAAFEKGDMAALEKLWANDASVGVFVSGHAEYVWAGYGDLILCM